MLSTTLFHPFVPRPVPHRFNLSEALTALDNGNIIDAGLVSSFLSELSYSPENSEQRLPGLPTDSIRSVLGISAQNDPNFYFFDDGKLTQGFAIANNRIVVIVFRGTQYDTPEGFVHDWVNNIDITLSSLNRNGDAIKVHNGFLKGINRIWNGLNEQTKLLQFLEGHPGKRIYCTGHSLGGSLAALVAEKCQVEAQREIAGVYTFGAPMAGNKAFANHYATLGLNSKTQRFVNNNDVVTRGPFAGSPTTPLRFMPQFFGQAFTFFNSVSKVLTVPASHPDYAPVGILHYIDENHVLHPHASVRPPETGWAGERLLDHRHTEYVEACRMASNNAPLRNHIPYIIDPLTPEQWPIALVDYERRNFGW